MRRVYLMQYSSEPVLTADGKKLWGNAEPFLKDAPEAPERFVKLMTLG